MLNVLKKQKLPEVEIDKDIEAIVALMQHWGWPKFTEVIQYMQAGLQTEIFSKTFLALDPIAKDKRHASIVEALTQMSRILELPEWLSRNKPSRWAEVTNYAIKKEK